MGAPLQNVEGGVGVDAVDVHHGALRLFDDGAVVGDFGDGLGDACLSCFPCGRDVDVEALRADYFTSVVVKSLSDDDDFADGALHGNYAIAGPVQGVVLRGVRPTCADLGADVLAWPSIDGWALVINTFTSTITFLLVALLQNTETRAENATQRKLNALAEALAELMDKLDAENPDLRRSRDELTAAVGVEQRESTK